LTKDPKFIMMSLLFSALLKGTSAIMDKKRKFLQRLSHILGGSKQWKPLLCRGLKRLPLSSEHLGPPKDLISAKDYASQNPLAFFEIIPEHSFSFPPFPLTYAVTGIGFKDNIPGIAHFPKSFVVILGHGRIYGGNGVIITDDDRVLEETAIEWIPSPSQHSIFKKLKLPTLRHSSEKIAVVASKSSTCYFHWMFDILPRIELLRRSGIHYDKLYINPLLHPFHKETCETLGLPTENMIFSDPKIHIKASELIIPSLPAPSGSIPKWACDFLRTSFLKNYAPKKRSRIYITRRNASSRKIVNEEELVEYLSRHGFKEAILENLSVREQAELFASAEMIVAPHGASLTNLVFCQPGTRVVEIFTPNYVNQCYWMLSQHQHIDHHCILGSTKNLTSKQKEDLDVFVKMQELASMLNT
jgi:capsular polysaccharide biosynthesis protein